MLYLADAGLASAVSRAGGLGVVSPLAGKKADESPAENFRRQMRVTRERCSGSFGANIPLDLPYAGLLIEAVLAEKPPVVITAGGDPDFYTPLLKAEGRIVLHVAASVRQAKKAEAGGVDAVVAQGIEAAAHNGRDEMPLFSLIPQVVERSPFRSWPPAALLTGGFRRRHGLGADGVQLGTRFVATEECPAHPAYKQASIQAGPSDTSSPAAPDPTAVSGPCFPASCSNWRPQARTPANLGLPGTRAAPDLPVGRRPGKREAYCGASAALSAAR
jgi:enoyl-[acyl-carrier protein] reductase II